MSTAGLARLADKKPMSSKNRATRRSSTFALVISRAELTHQEGNDDVAFCQTCSGHFSAGIEHSGKKKARPRNNVRNLRSTSGQFRAVLSVQAARKTAYAKKTDDQVIFPEELIAPTVAGKTNEVAFRQILLVQVAVQSRKRNIGGKENEKAFWRMCLGYFAGGVDQ